MKRTLAAVAVILISSAFVSSAEAHPWAYRYGYGPVVVAPAPSVVYAPRVYVPAPVPVYTYRVGVPYAVPGPLYYGRRAVVRSKVYYRGQPVRNYLKAITP